MLSSVPHLLPSFERPTNPRLKYFDNVMQHHFHPQPSLVEVRKSPPKSVSPASSVMFQDLTDFSVDMSVDVPDGLCDDLPNDMQNDVSVDEPQEIIQDNEDAFEHTVQSLSDAHVSFGLYIKKLKNQNRVHSKEEVAVVNALYLQLCRGLPKMSSICGLIELENCKRDDRQKVLHESDKQIRLAPVSQGNRAGRPKSTKVLRKPDSPEKRDIEKELIEGVKVSKKKMPPRKGITKAAAVPKTKSAKIPTRSSARSSTKRVLKFN